jgi:glycosyltransferase involved in cell wall biosynthesis
MKIAQVSPLYESVPPAGYGGTERVVSWLTDALVSMGHEVTLYASGGSHSKAKTKLFRDQPIRTDTKLISDVAEHMVMLHQVREDAHKYDLIHFHTDVLQMPMFEEIAEKTVTTLHGRLDMDGLEQFYNIYNNFPLVSISNNQRLAVRSANYSKTIYHGLPLDTYKPLYESGQNYAAFLGRFSPEKGPDKAINVATKAGVPIKLAAKICTQFHENKTYYKNIIEPMLSLDGVEYIGEINDRKKNDFLGNAKALMFPINWPEPFGLVMIEAMACGTPVIAWNYGSVPEVIEHGVTGFIVKNKEEAEAALRKIDTLDRRVIRKKFEERFSSLAMAKSYISLYEEILGENVAVPEKKIFEKYTAPTVQIPVLQAMKKSLRE